jgi:hypothetical protein
VTLINAAVMDDNDLELLRPLADQLLWLDASRTNITDAGLAAIGSLHNLTRLNLSYTEIVGDGLPALATLEKLERLNLVGTDVSDDALQALTTVRSLKQLFLFNSQVTQHGVAQIMETMPEISVDTGRYILPLLTSDTAAIPGIN